MRSTEELEKRIQYPEQENQWKICRIQKQLMEACRKEI